MNILITGASGYIGFNLIKTLNKFTNYQLSALVREKNYHFNNKIKQIIIDDIRNISKYEDQIQGFDCIIHLAGVAHKKFRNKNDFIDVNTKATESLIKICLKNKINRFIFISSVGVNGNKSIKPIIESDLENPKDLYSKSKLIAEKKIIDMYDKDLSNYVIIRCPLVYGKNAPGNFNLLVKWVNSFIPLPFGNIVKNKRSIISINNLIDFILNIIQNDKASNNIFFVSDKFALSTTQIINGISKNKFFSINIPIPSVLLNLFFQLIKKNELSTKLLDSFEIDITKSFIVLGWTPPFNSKDELNKSV